MKLASYLLLLRVEVWGYFRLYKERGRFYRWGSKLDYFNIDQGVQDSKPPLQKWIQAAQLLR